jgi:hypothetical protein
MSITLVKINERHGLSTSVGHREHSSSHPLRRQAATFYLREGGIQQAQKRAGGLCRPWITEQNHQRMMFAEDITEFAVRYYGV